jgi:YHS domain-containing protein
VLDVREALYAICSTGKGRCWHCDHRLPRADEAVRAGWDVQRVEGKRVASIILICPRCQDKPAELKGAARSIAAPMWIYFLDRVGGQMKVVDPVCKMTIEAEKATATSDYKGQTVHFCAKSCKAKFDAAPESYLAH